MITSLDIRNIKNSMSDLERRSLNLARFNETDELKFHNYIKDICQRLLGDEIDLEKEKVFFALSDQDDENAAYVHGSDDRYQLVFITRSLLSLCKTEDQLAFVLAHELGHFEEEYHQGEHINTKAEETAADLRAIQKMARAGYNLEEAHVIAEKLFQPGVRTIESLKDAHMNDITRKNAIDAMIIAVRNKYIEQNQQQNNDRRELDPWVAEVSSERPESLSQILSDQIDNSRTAEEATERWLEMLYSARIRQDNTYVLTEDDSRTFADATISIFNIYKNGADTFLATVFEHLENSHPEEEQAEKARMIGSVLRKNLTVDMEYDSSRIDINQLPLSRTGVVLNRYLHGFREASGSRFDEMIRRYEYVQSLVAEYRNSYYHGILVKNYNLFELEYNQNDAGKKISPQIWKYLTDRLKDDEFNTFSGLKVFKLNNGFLLKQQSKGWNVYVNEQGAIEYSFPDSELQKMQTKIVAKNIEQVYRNVQKIQNGEITDFNQMLAVYMSAAKILRPQDLRNSLKDIMPFDQDNKETAITFDDILAELPPDAAAFFAERGTRPYRSENLPQTSFVTERLAECIRQAPQEKFDEIFSYLNYRIKHLSGEDKLWRAFLDNPAFSQTMLENMYAVDESLMSLSRQLVKRLQEATDKKLYEHLRNGGDLKTFVPPFRDDFAKLCGLDKSFTKEEWENSINSDIDRTLIPSEQAYVGYYSYETLDSAKDANLTAMFGYNCAGYSLTALKQVYEYHLQRDSLGEAERLVMQQELNTVQAAYETVRRHFAEQVNDDKNWPGWTVDVLDDKISRGYDRTLMTKQLLLDRTLQDLQHTDNEYRTYRMLSLIVNASDLPSQESEALKRKIWPYVSARLSDKDASLMERIDRFTFNSTSPDLFNKDHKNYYAVLVGEDGKGGLLAELKNEPFPGIRFMGCKMLLQEGCRIPDPDIRQDVIKLAAESFYQAHGNYNDATALPAERQKIIEAIRRLKDSEIPAVDRIELFKELAETLQAQKELSLEMKPESLNIKTSDNRSILAAYGLDSITYMIQSYPEMRERMLDFLLGEGSLEEAAALKKEFELTACKAIDRRKGTHLTKRLLNGEDVSEDIQSEGSFYLGKGSWYINEEGLRIFKKEFDNAVLEQKTLLVNELLTSGSGGWNNSFKTVSSKLFAGAGDLAAVGSDFLFNYINARPDSEKKLYLAAMISAANNRQKTSEQYNDSPYTPEQRNLAKGLRLFLENSGPAGTKLAQAMSSYMEVPDFIRSEMQLAKSEANPPARWEIFSGPNSEITDKLLQYGPLGKRRGSASFFVTYDLGDKIVKILRPGAKIKADNEFKVYRSMLRQLKEKYENITSFDRLVQNAAENVSVETDLDVGLKQYKDAKELYPSKVTADGTTFKIKVMDWTAKDERWAILEKARGQDFKDLPMPYKKSVAKAILTTELANMLSGKRFDSDRHGGQYKIDSENNVIGVFDTGSMSVIEPTAKDRKALGTVLARTLIGIRRNPNAAAVFSQEIDRATKEFYPPDPKNENQSIPPYLSEFQRGLLALNDFYKDLPAKDLMSCLAASLNNGRHKIHQDIVNGFKAEMVPHLEAANENPRIMENMDKLAPEARADRRVGQILFDAAFRSMAEEKEINLPPEIKNKIMSRVASAQSGLQILKGVVRGAYAKLNPQNYSRQEREELGALLYEVCRADIVDRKLNKETDIQPLFEKMSTMPGEYSRNVGQMLKMISQIPNIDQQKVKRAATFVAFTDADVRKGYHRALSQDRSISFGKRLLCKLQPLDFIPRSSKKLLIKAVSRRFVNNLIGRQLSTQKNNRQENISAGA